MESLPGTQFLSMRTSKKLITRLETVRWFDHCFASLQPQSCKAARWRDFWETILRKWLSQWSICSRVRPATGWWCETSVVSGYVPRTRPLHLTTDPITKYRPSKGDSKMKTNNLKPSWDYRRTVPLQTSTFIAHHKRCGAAEWTGMERLRLPARLKGIWILSSFRWISSPRRWFFVLDAFWKPIWVNFRLGESDYHLKTLSNYFAHKWHLRQNFHSTNLKLSRGVWCLWMQDIKRRTKRVWLKLLEYQWALNCVSFGNQ